MGCLPHVGDARTAVERCSAALKIDNAHPKALFRRGEAHRALGDLDRARADLAAAAKAVPYDRAVRNALVDVSAALREQERAGNRLWQGKLQHTQQQQTSQQQQQQQQEMEDSPPPSQATADLNLCQRIVRAVSALFFGAPPPDKKGA